MFKVEFFVFIEPKKPCGKLGVFYLTKKTFFTKICGSSKYQGHTYEDCHDRTKRNPGSRRRHRTPCGGAFSRTCQMGPRGPGVLSFVVCVACSRLSRRALPRDTKHPHQAFGHDYAHIHINFARYAGKGGRISFPWRWPCALVLVAASFASVRESGCHISLH